jgi:serine phosphatase RsbU (regulator of sigma subunit)
MVKEQNVVLEHKVTERTLALNETNEELNTTLLTVEKQRDNIISSINYALRIQNAIIPKEQEIQKYFPESFVFFKPKDIVSGDFYWFADKGDKKIIVVADCTGHGVSGAFMTMIGNNILNQIVHDQEVTEPNEILNLMTPLLEKTLLRSEGKVKDGMDISVVSIEHLSGFENLTDVKITYAGAMNPLYYIQNQEFIEIKADKVPIGGKQKEGFTYQKHNLNLSGLGDLTDLTLYLCTDGFQDQFGGTEKRKFMVGKFKKFLLEISEKPMAEQKQILETTISNWMLAGNETQTDDICVLGIRI